MKYVVAGNAMAERITHPDGSQSAFMPGGASLFALTGIQLWSDEVLMCGGFGADYMQTLGPWLERNHIDRRAFNVRDPKNPLNYVFYRDEGGWDSRTEYGNEHFDRLDCNPALDHLDKYVSDAVGVAFFRGEDPGFYAQIFALRERFHFKLSWEIKGNFALPEKLPEIRTLCKNVDSFSINGPETYQLFGVDNDADAIAALRTLGCPLVIYRVGKRGLYILKGDETLFAPSYQKYSLVDVTGCGNSSTAAAFYAWCEGMDIYEIAACANVTAGHNLRFVGAMELSAELRTQALADRMAFAAELRKQSAG